METMYQYLYRIRVLPSGSQREVEQGKLKYRKLYKQAKQREYAKTRKRVELTFQKKEFDQLSKEAKKAGLAIPDYLRKAISSSRKNQAFIPSESTLYSLQMEIRRIGNNINQLAYHANRNKRIDSNAVAATRSHLNKIEDQIKEAFLISRP